MDVVKSNPMPNTKHIKWKNNFVKRYSKLTDFNTFKEVSLRFLRRSMRVNTLKIGVEELVARLKDDWILQPIPWCREGFWVEHRREEKRRDVGNLIEHALGYIYLQEAVSMIPPLVLNPQPGETVLDMCASPGSKSTEIAALMQNKGLLVCNDINGLRLKPLSINLQRVGAHCSIVTMMKGQWWKNTKFDRILVDAPCSGTGTIRKSLKTLRIWNPIMVHRLSSTQKQLISTAFSILKPGGTLVYSTCTLEPEENEEVIDYILKNFPDAYVKPINLNIVRSKPVLSFEDKIYDPAVSDALRLWPQDNDTEGFFVCKIGKRKI